MSSGGTCSECAAVIPSGAPGGLCANCLLALGLKAQEVPTATASDTETASSSPQLYSSSQIGVSLVKTKAVMAPLTEKGGDTIGRYKLLQQIGEGGLGVVYMAQQQEPIKRRVALKIIKLGMDTKMVVARFEAERQALAVMDHPNIAKVLDAGSTETGRPYFVMELVHGVKITDYCDQNNLPTRERLNLVVQICRAMQHAHQKGIIHRDIKPSNILVTIHDGGPVPKVIDFGIAKATQQELTEQTAFTELGQFLGTPAYMSPEQAEMSALDIDTRSDIYGLGVLLYELLTGTTPFETKELLEAGLEAMRRTIREKQPARPSRRLTTLAIDALKATAQRRKVEPQRLVKLIRGDLDWIVMKCLEKDRIRRYDTASALAEDLERYLDLRPVSAAAPTLAYRLSKFLRRHKKPLIQFAGLFLVGYVLLNFLITFSVSRLRQHDPNRGRFVNAYFRNIQRLQEGGPVFSGGSMVGRVDQISFDPNIAPIKWVVRVTFQDPYWRMLHVDGRAGIEYRPDQRQFTINIYPGSSNAPLVAAGTIIATEQ